MPVAKEQIRQIIADNNISIHVGKLYISEDQRSVERSRGQLYGRHERTGGGSVGG